MSVYLPTHTERAPTSGTRRFSRHCSPTHVTPISMSGRSREGGRKVREVACWLSWRERLPRMSRSCVRGGGALRGACVSIVWSVVRPVALLALQLHVSGCLGGILIRPCVFQGMDDNEVVASALSALRKVSMILARLLPSPPPGFEHPPPYADRPLAGVGRQSRRALRSVRD